MEKGVFPLSKIEKLCYNATRYMYLLNEIKILTFSTFNSFIQNELTASIDQISVDINTYFYSHISVSDGMIHHYFLYFSYDPLLSIFVYQSIVQ